MTRSIRVESDDREEGGIIISEPMFLVKIVRIDEGNGPVAQLKERGLFLRIHREKDRVQSDSRRLTAIRLLLRERVSTRLAVLHPG